MAVGTRKIWLIRAVMAVVVLSGLALFVPWDVGYAYLRPLSDTVQAEADSAARSGLEGVIIYVDGPNSEPALYAAGWKDRAAQIHADPHALFRIGSVSKLYIAVATTKLIAAGRLSADDTLANLLPEVAGQITNSERITLRMLIGHRSGIPEFVNSPGFEWDFETPDMLKLVVNRPADFAPDRRYRYSNSNYLLIGMILDRTLGYDHQTYIRSDILTPLGLTHTFGQLSDVDPANVVSGYVVKYEPDLKSLDYHIAGGSMIATAQDVGIFLKALSNGSLLSNVEQALYSQLYVYEHTGLLPGYQSFATYDKTSDTVIVLMVNTSGGSSWMKSEAVLHRLKRLARTKDSK